MRQTRIARAIVELAKLFDPADSGQEGENPVKKFTKLLTTVIVVLGGLLSFANELLEALGGTTP